MAGEEQEPRTISVQQFYEFGARRLGMKLAAGSDGLRRVISNGRVQKTGLALANFVEVTTQERVQLLGRTEMQYLEQLKPGPRAKMLENLFECQPACFLISNGPPLPTISAKWPTASRPRSSPRRWRVPT